MEFVKVAAWWEETVYEIICFDDGNDCLVRFPNEWRIVATNLRGKVRLENVRTGYTVQSISEWKVTECRSSPKRAYNSTTQKKLDSAQKKTR